MFIVRSNQDEGTTQILVTRKNFIVDSCGTDVYQLWLIVREWEWERESAFPENLYNMYSWKALNKINILKGY